MKEFNIKITDTEVYINGELQHFSCPMDKEDKEDDLNKKAILALAGEMGYEAQFLFEEMADRLEEMLDEIEEDDDNDFLQDLVNDDITQEFIETWKEQLLEATGKASIKDLTIEEIKAEIADVKGTIDNETILIGVTEFAEQNIEHYQAWLEILEEMLKNKEE
jgi:anion-transporting  ArsA/GET3 family ATPase